MSAFLVIFFSLYSLMHVYVFVKAKAALSLGLRSGVPLALFMVLMICAPVIVRVLEKAGHELLAQIMSFVGYVWLGIVFLFISAALVIDFYRLCLYGIELVTKKDVAHIRPSPQISFALPLILSSVISVYGYFEALNIRTERLTIRTPKITKETGRVRIVQISDVHLGLIVREARLKRILDIVLKENPDILVSTGDLVDGQIDRLAGLPEMLREIQPRHGKFAITGNHEFYAGLEQALRFTEGSGFTLLRGTSVALTGLITIAGIDDPTIRTYEKNPTRAEHEVLSGLPRDTFTLFLKHRPLVEKNSLGLFDLQLSGHTHKGQIFPFSIITWFYYPVDAGCIKPVDNCYLYVSRGTGTWGPPIRFLSPPQVTVIELVHDGKDYNIRP